MQKSIYVESLGYDVILAKRKGTRTMRLAVKSDGTIRLSVPFMVSKNQALRFLNQKSDWIAKHHKKPLILSEGAHIGKSHRLEFQVTDIESIKTRLSTNKIIIKLPLGTESSSQMAQTIARKACERALKKESETLIPQRLKVLSKIHGIEYRSCIVKKLKSRWGSCDSYKNITLNIYLIQLDWRLIDYVILHELTHTIHQHHQAEFWNYLESLLPDSKIRRKELKQMPTDILPTSF
jgi:predicted metal-dependent hydrolase